MILNILDTEKNSGAQIIFENEKSWSLPKHSIVKKSMFPT